MSEDEDLATAIIGFFTNPDALPKAPTNLKIGSIWWEERDGWLLPWRITGQQQGYPCGEPKKV